MLLKSGQVFSKLIFQKNMTFINNMQKISQTIFVGHIYETLDLLTEHRAQFLIR